jgi:hypothetical protein
MAGLEIRTKEATSTGSTDAPENLTTAKQADRREKLSESKSHAEFVESG